MDDRTPDRPDLDSLIDFGKPAASETRVRKLIETAADPSWALEARCILARTLGLQRKFSEAHETLAAVEKELTPETKRARTRYLLERGRVLNTSGKPKEAKPLFVKAWDEAQGVPDDYLAIDAVHMIAIVETPKKQIEWGLKGLALAERTGDKKARKWIGALTNNLGWTYHDLKQYDKALDMFQRGVRFREEQKQVPQLRIAKYAVARCLRSMGRIDEALEIQQALDKELKAAGEADGYVYEELGELLLLKHRDAEAAAQFARAYEELSKDDWLVKNDTQRVERIKRLGKVK